MSRNHLLIPFSQKDRLKAEHRLKWDSEKKLWYTDNLETYESLKRYHITVLHIPFANRDGAKKLGCKWNGTHWYTSYESYEFNRTSFEYLTKEPDNEEV